MVGWCFAPLALPRRWPARGGSPWRVGPLPGLAVHRHVTRIFFASPAAGPPNSTSGGTGP
eukprot:scaffold2547_cov299-Prasinococcus_capsulatus_cf.AAC.4